MKATDEELAEYLEMLLSDPRVLTHEQIVRRLLNAFNFGVPWNRIKFADD